ncbi:MULTISPECIES: TonB-dependent receptor [unclassified Mucilaginibacter]|uniref:TonB-dependent receptor domain-containing protein n=1 Tax=unclassified Mucilaginibacter TaxID=2617802 RepID=UPI002AC8F7CA|nr:MULTISPECIES: TonB-dependent receptor [unclassified Mucilaginibacter]MEB0260971.1 TonB-dependent receptor [Mucilaginibacter sp. 10I4]MEB0279566.1 TonB-dependent receptor [Mucilaginibacter sp. 10B2]MEB0302033.1 TonB-dependent receptor [Mucilaginibacter sp. 5C4]WPX22566.1 TonB-dependent receptor [Mucilaginibacter sp. 5C4]
MKNRLLLFISTIVFVLITGTAFAQQLQISGTVKTGNKVIEGATVTLLPDTLKTASDAAGHFAFNSLKPGSYEVLVTYLGAETYRKKVNLKGQSITLSVNVKQEDTRELSEVNVQDTAFKQASGNLRQIEGTAIYAGKKTEVINIGSLNANLATNNTRQIYSRAAGINIIEYDGGGLQLGIGGRGLNPSRVSNFNTRQNGYDISADALGYPESYYTPTTEAVDRIEIIRGAASLQYGTQFGGLINFKMKQGPANKPFEITSRQTVGSFGFFNTFNSIGGSTKKLNYYAYYQYKRGDGWRPNSRFSQHGAYIHLDYAISDKLKITGEYTYMDYLAHLPGGLTDQQFAEDAHQSVRARNWFKVNWNLASISLDYKFSDNTKLNWRTYHLDAGRTALGILDFINTDDDGGPRDMLKDHYDNYGTELRVLHQYKLGGTQINSLLTGVRVYKGKTLRSQGAADAGSGPVFEYSSAFPSSSQYTFPGINVAVFTENIFQITDKWSVTPGARFEFISTKADGYYTKRSSPYPDYYLIQTPETKVNNRSFVFFGIGTSYKPAKGVEVYANISQNYRSVNFNDIRVLNQNARVDSNLTDERGYTIDGGVRGNINSFMRYDVSVFYLKYNRRIGSVFTASDDYTVAYRFRKNIGDSRNIGLESLLEADLLKAFTQGTSKYKLSVFTNFALIDAKYVNSLDKSVLKGNKVEFVPPVLFRTGLSFGNKRFDVSYQFSYVGKQYSDATNTEYSPRAVDGVVPAYKVMDLSASYNWKWFTLSGSINNLANEKYFTRRADGYPGPGILPSDPRGYYMTLQIKY